MIILDNIIFSLQKAGGISVVWQNLIKELLLSYNDLLLLEYQNVLQNIFRKNLTVPLTKIKTLRNFNSIYSQFTHPVVNCEHSFIFHSSYFRTCNNPNAVNVTTVHDFIYEQNEPTLKQRLRINLNYKTIRKSDAIVCISENTKKDLFNFIPNINQEKVHVIYNGVSEDYRPLITKPYPEYNNHILFVGGRQGYKNFKFTVKAISDTKFNLLICGKPLSNEEKILLDTHLPNKYSIILFPSNEELNKIYNSVYALVYPSSYEGFGIPILEAQRANCPVIAFNSSSVPEVAGEGAILLNSLTQDALIQALHSLDIKNYRTSLTEKGYINSKRFSWKKMAENYLGLYQQLLKSKHN